MDKDRITPFFFQSAAHDCVPACVLAMAQYYGVSIHIKQLRLVLVTDPASGTVLKNLNNLSPWFRVQMGRIVNLSELATYTPFIAYLTHHHAVIVWGYTADGKRLKIGDPAVGLVEMRMDELLRIWDGITVVLRPLEEVISIESVQDGAVQNDTAARHDLLARWTSRLHLDDLRTLHISWWSMAWASLIVTLLGAANAAYSLYYAQFLPYFSKFTLFVLAYAAVSGVLTWISSLVQMKLALVYQRKLAWRIEEALRQIDLRFYTMGDISTRYQDASTVIGTVMGLFRDIPYSIIIFGASLYFLGKISWLLVIFTVAFLLLIISILSPLVKRVQHMVYNIRLKQADMTNKLKIWLSGGHNEVTASFNEMIGAQYKQSIWSIPISTMVGNSVVIPVLFVVVFLHWKQGDGVAATTAGYSQLFAGIMIMNYAVSAGHGLYGKIVAWQMALPSLQRLKDFLEVDVDDPVNADGPSHSEALAEPVLLGKENIS